MKKILISASIFALSLTANAQGQFISDTNYRNTVENIFKERVKTVGKTFYNTQKENLTADEQEALKFLYAYMPLADVTDYPTSFFADNVRMSFKARKEMPCQQRGSGQCTLGVLQRIEGSHQGHVDDGRHH